VPELDSCSHPDRVKLRSSATLLRRISCAAFCSAAVTIPATAQETTRVSVDSSGAESDRNSSHFGVPALSSDGRFVVFASAADNLVAGDRNGVVDVFVHESCSTADSWSNYGAGFPGTNGVPTFTSQQNGLRLDPHARPRQFRCKSDRDLQAIEADPGAAKGVSSTAGLELLLGL